MAIKELALDDGVFVLIFLVRLWALGLKVTLRESPAAPCREFYINHDVPHFFPQSESP